MAFIIIYTGGTSFKIPSGQQIFKIKNFSNIFVPTLAVDVKCSGNYNDIISIFKYVDTYENVGGVNAPKKIICIGSDGIQREQLLKVVLDYKIHDAKLCKRLKMLLINQLFLLQGKDDLRQDAVMQQVFNVMNRLFEMSKEAKRRKLKIRTYKVKIYVLYLI